jgi:hypothetical protein
MSTEKKTHFAQRLANQQLVAVAACGISMYPNTWDRPDYTDEPRWVTCNNCKSSKTFKNERSKCVPMVGDE